MLIDAIIIITLLLAVLIGFNRGLIRALTGVASFFVAFVLTMVLRAPFAKLLYGSAVGQGIYQRIFEEVEGAALSGSMPEYLRMLIGETLDNALYNSAAAIAEVAAGIVVDILSGVILLIVLTVIVQLAAGLLRKVFDLPILKTIDRLGGLALGAVCGLIIVYILCAVLKTFMISADSFWLDQLNHSTTAKYFFDKNFILDMLT